MTDFETQTLFACVNVIMKILNDDAIRKESEKQSDPNLENNSPLQPCDKISSKKQSNA